MSYIAYIHQVGDAKYLQSLYGWELPKTLRVWKL